MSIADQINQMNLRETKEKEFNEFRRSIGLFLTPEDGMKYDYEDEGTLYVPCDTFNYNIVSNIFKEAVSLIKEDRWKESVLKFEPSHYSDGFSKYYNDTTIYSKIKAPDGKVYIVHLGRYHVDPPNIKHKFYNPYYKQVFRFTEKKINHYYDNIRALLYGSQKYVRDHEFILFQDGYCFHNSTPNERPFWLIPGKPMQESELHSLESHLASFVRTINQK